MPDVRLGAGERRDSRRDATGGESIRSRIAFPHKLDCKPHTYTHTHTLTHTTCLLPFVVTRGWTPIIPERNRDAFPPPFVSETRRLVERNRARPLSLTKAFSFEHTSD